MRKGFLGSLAVLATGAGLAFGQQFMPPGGGPGPLPGTLPPPGMTTGYPPPGVAPGAYAGPSGADAGYMYSTPDGHPVIMGPGMEGMVPPGSMGAGAPGGAYDEGQGSRGILAGLFGGRAPRRFWVGGEYLLWTTSSMGLKYPLASTSAPIDLGVLGTSTAVAPPDVRTSISTDSANGFRGWFGLSFDESGMFGAELSGFNVVNRGTRNWYPGNGIGMPVLAVPFIDINAGGPGAYIVSFPGINQGEIRVGTDTQTFGAEANLVYNLSQPNEGPGGVSFFGGLRFFELKERLDYYTSSTTFGVPPLGPFAPPLGNGPAAAFFPAGGGLFAGAFFPGILPPPYQVTTFDAIRTYNQFYGANVGFRGDVGFGRWFAEVTGKIAVGWMRQWVDLYGYSNLTSSGTTSNQLGGLFNLAQDLGRHRKDRIAIMPEGGVTLGYQAFSWLRLTAGYTYIYTNSVIRPTSSLSPFLNPALVPVSPTYGLGQPGYGARDVTESTGFHLHGFTAGLQISF